MPREDSIDQAMGLREQDDQQSWEELAKSQLQGG